MHVSSNIEDDLGPYISAGNHVYFRDEYAKVGRIVNIRGSVADGYPIEAGENWRWDLVKNFYLGKL